jgi:predicted MPP superfamily phosphohydrolase
MKKLRILIRVVTTLGVVFTGFGFYYYAHNDDSLALASYEVVSKKYKGSKPFRIVQLSDFHNHSLSYSDGDLLEKINALEPDVIVSTGDFIDNHTKDFTMIEAMVASWKAKGIPFYYVDGNHERKAPSEITAKEHEIFNRWGKNLYHEKSIDFGNGVHLSGVRDPAAKGVYEWAYVGPYEGDVPDQLSLLAPAFDSSSFNILLCHRPDLFDLAEKNGYDLMFAGHTHGGQILLGSWPIALYPWTEYVAGSYTKGASRLLVSRGLGESYNLPVRHNCKAEIVLTTIKSEA